MSKDWEVDHPKHIFREANQCADDLAKFGQAGPSGLRLFSALLVLFSKCFQGWLYGSFFPLDC